MIATADENDNSAEPGAHSLEAPDQQFLLAAAERQASSLAAAAAADPIRQRSLLLVIVQRVAVHRDRVEIWIDRSALSQTLDLQHQNKPMGANRSDAGYSEAGTNLGRLDDERDGDRLLKLTIQVAFRRAGNELRLIVLGKAATTPPDQSLIRILARAQTLFAKLSSDPELTIAELAMNEGLNNSYVSRLIRLTFLAPDIIASILEGQQPVTLTANKLMADTRLPIDWAEQRRVLGSNRQWRADDQNNPV